MTNLHSTLAPQTSKTNENTGRHASKTTVYQEWGFCNPERRLTENATFTFPPLQENTLETLVASRKTFQPATLRLKKSQRSHIYYNILCYHVALSSFGKAKFLT